MGGHRSRRLTACGADIRRRRRRESTTDCRSGSRRRRPQRPSSLSGSPAVARRAAGSDSGSESPHGEQDPRSAERLEREWRQTAGPGRGGVTGALAALCGAPPGHPWTAHDHSGAPEGGEGEGSQPTHEYTCSCCQGRQIGPALSHGAPVPDPWHPTSGRCDWFMATLATSDPAVPELPELPGPTVGRSVGTSRLGALTSRIAALRLAEGAARHGGSAWWANRRLTIWRTACTER